MRARKSPKANRRARSANCSVCFGKHWKANDNNRAPLQGRSQMNELRVGIVSVSARASGGVYKDEGIPALMDWLSKAVKSPALHFEERLIPDEKAVIEETLRELIDEKGCHLVLTTGGTGPAPRDVTPEATLAVADKEMPGFGRQMRAASLRYVPTAILSRQVAVIRHR